MNTERLKEVLTQAKHETGKVIIGQHDVIEKALIAIFTGSHALVEGVPGVAKTLLVRTLAHVLGADFARIQFTPDLMPADITGTNVFNLQRNEFSLIKGPVFTSFLLADEINRAPAKTQSALLQAMQERVVTIDRDTHVLPPNFTVFATQNPIEYEGTYPLPEAQKDRFMLKITMAAPDRAEELALAQRTMTKEAPEALLQQGVVQPVIKAEDLVALREGLASIVMRDELVAYLVDIVRATRTYESILVGAGPRATQSLIMAARAYAAINGRDFTTPDDVRTMAPAVLEHRIILRPEFEIEGLSVTEVIQQILQQIAVPPMIVPSTRLLFWVAVIVPPFALLGAVAPASLVVALVFIAAFLLVAVLDAAGAVRSLEGIKVELPAVVRMSKDRAAAMEVKIRKQQTSGKKVRMALEWPPEIKPAEEELEVMLPAETEWSRLSLPCTPLKRGRYTLTTVRMESASPMGFWVRRQSLPVSAELRVYPNLLTERKSMAALFLNRGGFGIHSQRQIGKGREFEKLREYVPGDGYDEIHWKVTARRGKPITKVFQIEKTQEIYVIVDASRLTARTADSGGLGGPSVLERFVTSALVLGLAAEQQGDLFGLLTFSDKVEKFVRAKNGQSHYNACRDALYTLQPRIVTPDFDELCTFIRTRLRRRALLVFLTALDDPGLAESFVRNIELIRRQHVVLVNMVQAPGVQPLFSEANFTEVDDMYRQLGGHLRWHNLHELQKVLQRRGVRFSLLGNERMSAELVSQYIGVKQRQLL